MKFIFRRLFLIFVAIFFATTLNAKEGKVIGSSNHEVPSWFKDSFLDISEDIEEATEKNKHFMIFLDFEGCPYCSKMLKESFEEDNKTSQFIKNNFDVIELNVKGSRELTWVDEDVLTEKDLTEKLKIQYSPTLLIFNSNKEIVARVNGYRNSKDFQYILDFIQTKSYEKMDFTSYLSKLDKKDTYIFIPNKMFKDLNDLSKIKTPVAIIFEDKSCIQCDHFHNKILTNKDVIDEFSKFTVIRVDANSTKELILPTGEKTTPKSLVEKINLDYRP
ncbi:MAG TPA: thioredoxin fold domain-containing protein, partial [Aliarcobacter cryaerophilus]|nr:thioredoxin fold domain-containing protein [Aliarcobacter cryaerophilus]